jgi:hypothetical protein
MTEIPYHASAHLRPHTSTLPNSAPLAHHLAIGIAKLCSVLAALTIETMIQYPRHASVLRTLLLMQLVIVLFARVRVFGTLEH